MTKRRTRKLPLVTSAFLVALLVPPVGQVAGMQAAGADSVLAPSHVGAPAPVLAQAEPSPSPAPHGPEATDKELQAIMDSLTSESVAGMLAEVVDEHGHRDLRSGTAELGKKRSVPADGRFRIGSVTKSFVSTVVLQLVAEGRLSLDDTVERWLPGLVPGGDKITLRHLLNHTSGIFNYTDDRTALPLLGQRFLDETRNRTLTPLELVKIATAHPANFAPGTAWSYSNTNYILAGLVIEKVTGHPWSEEVRTRIVEPLGLKNTQMPATSKAIKGPHSHGYILVYDGRRVRNVDVTELNPSWAGAAGEIISTTADINTFYAALLGGKLLGPTELAAMKATVDTAAGFRYGLALFQIDLPCGVTLWGHDGGVPGYVTAAFTTGDLKRQFTVSMNPALERANLNQLVITAFCGPDMPAAPASIPMPSAAMR